MSKTTSKNATISNVEPATTADVDLAATLIPSTRRLRGWTATATLIETFSNPKMQTSLRSISNELDVLGIDVEDVLQAADEGAAVFGALGRLDESAGRVHQRVTELNKRILSAQTAILKAKKTSASGTALATSLRGLAGLRQKQVTQSKRSKAKAKSAKKKAQQSSGTQS